MVMRHLLCALLPLSLTALACQSDKPNAPLGPPSDVPIDPGITVSPPPEPADVVAERQKLQALLADVRGLTVDQLRSRFPVPLTEGPNYDPATARHLDLIQGSRIALT